VHILDKWANSTYDYSLQKPVLIENVEPGILALGNMMKSIQLPTRLQKYSGLKIDSENVLPISEDSWWVTLNAGSDSDNGLLEGKFHLPSELTTKLIIFQPGFPGGGSTDFERLHVKELLFAGHAIFTARHRGTIINGKHSEYYINCTKRQEKAALEKQKVLGNGHSSFDDWFKEPLIAVDSLAAGFEEIILVGHSLGALAILSSAIAIFKRKSEMCSKVKTLVSLAGVGGRVRNANDRVLKRWDEFFYAEWAQERLEIGGLADNIGYIREAHEQIHNFADVIPPSVKLICVIAYGDTEESVDELIPPQEALDVIVSFGRGTLVVDKTERPDPKTGSRAHELFALKTDDFLKLIDPAWNPTKQILRLDTQGIR
jgi:pimeloyl-ACP methyl ester carboxylesterase